MQTFETKATLVLSSQVPETEPNTKTPGGFVFARVFFVNSHTCQLPMIVPGAIVFLFWFFFFICCSLFS